MKSRILTNHTMNKQLRKIYINNTDYLVNIFTRLVTKQVDGQTVYAEGDEALRVLRAVESRMRSQRAKRDRDEAMRSIGLTRVVGALGGVYWE